MLILFIFELKTIKITIIFPNILILLFYKDTLNMFYKKKYRNLKTQVCVKKDEILL